MGLLIFKFPSVSAALFDGNGLAMEAIMEAPECIIPGQIVWIL